MSSSLTKVPDQTATPQEDGRVVFSIPVALFDAFPDQKVILSTADPAEPPVVLGPEVPKRVAFVQLTDVSRGMAPLEDWGEGLPLDLIMRDPAAELPLLYRCTGLLDRHPTRVTVPLLPGLGRAMKLALSLRFAVRLSGHQPAPEVIAEARQALDGYLHNPTVAQPVEPFHGLLLALLHGTPLNLWTLLERDPGEVRVFDDAGAELTDEAPASVAAFRDELLAAGAECRGCDWLAVCHGYFKWPNPTYTCGGVKQLLADLRVAAGELHAGLAAHDAAHGGDADGG
jgi:hypothetical protein